jgi:hypothetical protein
MIILSKGWKLPETGDFGSEWFPALEDNIVQLNSHKHDGLDSEQIEGIALKGFFITVPQASFVDQGNGYYRALVNVPQGKPLSDFMVSVKDPVTKDPVYLKQERVTDTSFYLFSNVLQSFEVYFGV